MILNAGGSMAAAAGGGNTNAGVPVSAQLVSKDSTGTSATVISANGKGFTDVIVYAPYNDAACIVKLTVDGVTIVNNAIVGAFGVYKELEANKNMYCYQIQVRFNSSINIWIDSRNGNPTYARGIVYFEE